MMKARIVVAALCVPLSIYAQANSPLVIQRITDPIVLDGMSDEPTWQGIKPLPLTMHTPVYEGDPTEQTEIRIAYDDEFIYISGRCYDSDPSGVQANSVVRDVDRGGDFLNVLLDTFNDKQNFLGFFTTPGGNRLDREIANDADGIIDPNNFSWNSYWNCETVQNDQGWFAEMRIPFSSLRFQDHNGRVVFGLIVHRLIARKNERLTFPSIPPKQVLSVWKASQAQEIEFEGIYRTNPVHFSPYVLVGNNSLNKLNGDLSGYTTLTETSKEIGFDFKYGLANNITLDVTANTDFAQVEADDQQINLTRFSLFYPERRQFFQERAGIFDFRYAGTNRLFHSRKIGLTESGKPVRILGGVRLVGRIEAWDVGVIDMQTERSAELPAENFNVLRLRRNVFNKDSYVGMMETGRFGSDGSHNIVTGLDGFFRLSDPDYFLIHFIQGFRSDIKQSPFYEQLVMSLDWQRRTSEGFGGNLTTVYVGDYYDPGVGYNQRGGGTEISGNAVYGFFDNENPVIRKHTATISWYVFMRNKNLSKESGVLGCSWQVDFKSGSSLTVATTTMYEGVLDTLAFAEHVHVMPGSYTFHDVGLGYSMSPGMPLRVEFGVGYGSFYDGTRLNIFVGPTWNISRYCEIGAEYEFNEIRFRSREEQLNASIARVRIMGAVNHNFSVNAFIQYSNVANILGNSVRLRYNFREGIDAYVVYNNAMWADRHRNSISLPTLDKSTLVLKYIHTFSP